ncbi:MAG: outer membrane protein assembly factor BamB [Pseudomonadota bacterium]
MKTGVRIGLLTLVLLTLSGCQTLTGWFSSDDDVLPPAELVDFSPTITFNKRWSVNAGDGQDERLGVVRPFHADGEIWVADHEGQISAFAADSGREIRRFETDLSLSGGPAVYDDLVLVGTFNGQLVALDRETGSERWRARLSSELLSFPVLHDGIVVARCIDGRTFGFDRADGTRLWVFDRSIPLLTLRGNSDPLARAGQIYLGYDDGTVVGLDVATGGLNWEQRVSIPEGRTELERLADIDGPMAIVGTDLYVTTYAGRLASLAGESGRILWVKDLASFSGLSLQRTQLAAVDSDDTIWMVDRRNGSTLWSDERLVRRELTRPAFLGDIVTVVDFEGYLHGFNAEDGSYAGRVRATRERPAAAPLVVGNTLYLLDQNGTLSAWSVSR